MASIIGLTGSIGSGKSTVTAFFREAGIPVIDADALSRALTGPGEAGSRAVAQTFGPDYLKADGAMDRARMRELVFRHPESLRTLENLLHPLIAQRVEAAFKQHEDAPLIIYDCPLLYQKALRPITLERILVIDAPDDIRLQRILKRPGLVRDTALRMMQAQPSRAVFLRLADDILSNAGSLDDLREALLRFACRLRIAPLMNIGH